MTCNKLNSIYEDYFDSSTLNHISPTPSFKRSLEHTISPIHNMVPHSKPGMDSPNQTPIIQILKNSMKPIDYEHPTGETTNDQRKLAYIYDFELPPPLNTMFGPPIDVSIGKHYLVLSQNQILTLLLLLVSNLFFSNLSKLSLLKSSPHKNHKMTKHVMMKQLLIRINYLFKLKLNMLPKTNQNPSLHLNLNPNLNLTRTST